MLPMQHQEGGPRGLATGTAGGRCMHASLIRKRYMGRARAAGIHCRTLMRYRSVGRGKCVAVGSVRYMK